MYKNWNSGILVNNQQPRKHEKYLKSNYQQLLHVLTSTVWMPWSNIRVKISQLSNAILLPKSVLVEISTGNIKSLE